MSGRIGQNDVPIRSGLVGGPHRAEPQCLGLGLAEVVNGEVEVHLFGTRALRPGRRLMIGDAHRRDPHPIGLDRHELEKATSPPSSCAQNVPRATGSLQSNETEPTRMFAMEGRVVGGDGPSHAVGERRATEEEASGRASG